MSEIDAQKAKFLEAYEIYKRYADDWKMLDFQLADGREYVITMSTANDLQVWNGIFYEGEKLNQVDTLEELTEILKSYDKNKNGGISRLGNPSKSTPTDSLSRDNPLHDYMYGFMLPRELGVWPYSTTGYYKEAVDAPFITNLPEETLPNVDYGGPRLLILLLTDGVERCL